MPMANTYRVERLLGPYGFSITDITVIDRNRLRPATFSKVGDSIDLNKVDIKTLVRSAVRGQLNKLLVGGAMSTMQQEVSVEKEREIQDALAEFGIGTYIDHPVASIQYRSLEPGVMVAVNTAVEKPKEVEIHQPPAAPMTMELEPGIVVPSGNAGGGDAEVLAAPVEEAAPAKSTKKKAETKKEKQETADPYADWKFNLDFQTQKRTILESMDKNFLEWVAKNDDSIQFQKLAKTRLAEA